jgi:hypothetical protein
MNETEEFDAPTTQAAQMLAAIDAEQNQLLTDLDALNDRIESLLRECQPRPEIMLPRAA